MKKEYEKPQIEIEDFKLSEGIAAGCDAGNDYSILEAWKSQGYFNDDCTITEWDDLPEIGGVKYCYHTSAEGSTIFSS